MCRILEPAVRLPDHIKRQNQRRRQVSLEECRHGRGGATGGPEGRVELRGETEEVEEGAEVGAVDAEGGAVGKFGNGVATQGPSAAEADVCDADGAVDEEVGEAGEGEEPGEKGGSDWGLDMFC